MVSREVYRSTGEWYGAAAVMGSAPRAHTLNCCGSFIHASGNVRICVSATSHGRRERRETGAMTTPTTAPTRTVVPTLHLSVRPMSTAMGFAELPTTAIPSFSISAHAYSCISFSSCGSW